MAKLHITFVLIVGCCQPWLISSRFLGALCGLNWGSISKTGASQQECISWCGEQNFELAGLTQGSLCKCGNDILSNDGSLEKHNVCQPETLERNRCDSGCTEDPHQCLDDSSEVCGGAKWFSLYSTDELSTVNALYACHCKGGQPCLNTTGECENGCEANWYGPACDQAGPQLKYGPYMTELGTNWLTVGWKAWKAGVDFGIDITDAPTDTVGYQLQYRIHPFGFFFTNVGPRFAKGAKDFTVNITGLKLHQTYDFRVRMYYLGDKQEPSPTVNLTTACGIPTAPPFNLVATGRPGAINLTWQLPPTDYQGCDLVSLKCGYKCRDCAGQVVKQGTVQSALPSPSDGLDLTISQTYAVCKYDCFLETGYHGGKGPLDGVTGYCLPQKVGTVRNLQAHITLDYKLVILWEPPSDTECLENIYYVIVEKLTEFDDEKRNLTDTVVEKYKTAANFYEISGVSASVSYIIEVSAENIGGHGNSTSFFVKHGVNLHGCAKLQFLVLALITLICVQHLLL